MILAFSSSLGLFAVRSGLCAFAVAVVVTYVLAWFDLISNGQVGVDIRSIVGAVPYSIGYWITSVLPYWWALIVIFVVAITIFALCARLVFRHIVEVKG
jgi:hypothetical protein